MSSRGFPRQLWSALRSWWREQAREKGAAGTSSLLVRNLWDFVRESMPERRRQRYGDVEYDWENRVNTTSGTVGWHARLLGLFHSPYQPTDPALFREMMACLPIEFDEFTFIDLGSGKGRTLLMASEYPFRRIVGVELIAELHRAAEENIRDYKSPTQRCTTIESMLADAREFELPEEPLLLYLFNPLPMRALSEVLERLEKSLARAPRPVWVVYHNPLLERVIGEHAFFVRVTGTEQYSIYSAGKSG
ncbi:MAG TPA: class I SAM-dependent methyltransferase [Terriglobales bacterium]|nr:class I SAM-dependent methyltransferase [Terriglobales bacterium]